MNRYILGLIVVFVVGVGVWWYFSPSTLFDAIYKLLSSVAGIFKSSPSAVVTEPVQQAVNNTVPVINLI